LFLGLLAPIVYINVFLSISVTESVSTYQGVNLQHFKRKTLLLARDKTFCKELILIVAHEKSYHLYSSKFFSNFFFLAVCFGTTREMSRPLYFHCTG
jgi:hypothetical protein